MEMSTPTSRFWRLEGLGLEGMKGVIGDPKSD